MALDFGVNYLAVIAATVAALVFGFIYYGALGLRARWLGMVGQTSASTQPPPSAAAAGLVAALADAWVLALLALNLHATSVTDGVIVGLLVWFGFMASDTLATIAFEERPWGLWVLQNIHHVIAQVGMALIVTLWR